MGLPWRFAHAIIVGANIPFALFFSIIILVLRGQDANLLSVGAVDFGIIVDAAVILVENVYRNFQAEARGQATTVPQSCRAALGARPRVSQMRRKPRRGRTGCGSSSSAPWKVEKAVFFSTAIIVAAFIPLFTMQGVEGQIFSPMAQTYAYALVGALLATFIVTPCLTSLLLPATGARGGNDPGARLACGLHAGAAPSLRNRKTTIAIGLVFLAVSFFLGSRLGSEFADAGGGKPLDCATMPPTISLDAGMPIVNRIREIILKHPESSRSPPSTAAPTTAAMPPASSTPNSSCR